MFCRCRDLSIVLLSELEFPDCGSNEISETLKYATRVLKNHLGVLRPGSGRTEWIEIVADFPFMLSLVEAFFAFFSKLLGRVAPRDQAPIQILYQRQQRDRDQYDCEDGCKERA